MEFDPVEAARKHRKEAETTVYPVFATYHIQGEDAPAVKRLFLELCNKFGEVGESRLYLPLEIVMKTLVGSDAYVGYIQSIDDGTPIVIEVEFYQARIESLKYALLQVFPNLQIEIAEHN